MRELMKESINTDICICSVLPPFPRQLNYSQRKTTATTALMWLIQCIQRKGQWIMKMRDDRRSTCAHLEKLYIYLLKKKNVIIVWIVYFISCMRYVSDCFAPENNRRWFLLLCDTCFRWWLRRSTRCRGLKTHWVETTQPFTVLVRVPNQMSVRLKPQ